MGKNGRLPSFQLLESKIEGPKPSSCPLVRSPVGVPLGPGVCPPRTPPTRPALPAAANTRRSGLASRGKPGRLGQRTGHARQPGRLSVASRKRSHQGGSCWGSGGDGGGGRQDGSGKGRPGKAAVRLRPASRPESAIRLRSLDAALPRISFRGRGLGERNSGGCRDSGAR